MVQITICTPMGELLTSPIESTKEKVISGLKEEGPMDFELVDGKTAIIPPGMTTRCMYIIKEV